MHAALQPLPWSIAVVQACATALPQVVGRGDLTAVNACPRAPRLQAHNLILVAWSVYMSFGICLECIPKGYKLWGMPFNPAHTGVSYYFYHFYVSKFYEFMDTYIMLYR